MPSFERSCRAPSVLRGPSLQSHVLGINQEHRPQIHGLALPTLVWIGKPTNPEQNQSNNINKTMSCSCNNEGSIGLRGPDSVPIIEELHHLGHLGWVVTEGCEAPLSASAVRHLEEGSPAGNVAAALIKQMVSNKSKRQFHPQKTVFECCSDRNRYPA